MEKIKFIPLTEEASTFHSPPMPAVSGLPDWYKKMAPYTSIDRSAGISTQNSKATNTTLKACTPFLDAMSMGYVYVAQADIEIRHVAGQYVLRWRTDDVLVESHSTDQHPGMPPAYNGTDFAMKWECGFKIQTPPGYSTIYTHPINRHDLPFRTFSGVVDTDLYPLVVNFPFQLVGEPKDITIIEAGTPLCQMIPFRRENWVSAIGAYDPIQVKKDRYDFMSRIVRAYKSRYWHKKSFV